MEVLQRIVFKYKTTLDLRSGLQVKSLQIFQKLVVIGSLTKKSRKVKGNNSPNEKPTCEKCSKKHYGDFFKGKDIALVVVKMGIRLGIAQMGGVKTRVVVKLMQFFIVLLQRRTTSMPSALGVRKGILPTW